MTTLTIDLDPEIKNLLISIDGKLSQLLGEQVEKMYTMKEASLLLGLGYSTVRELAERGEIETINVGTGEKNSMRRISRESLERFKSKRAG
jgi:excisionase family DNA binding protein